jgi:hypothetical protein
MNRGLAHRTVAVFTAGNSPERIQARILSGETRRSFASSFGVHPCSFVVTIAAFPVNRLLLTPFGLSVD